MKQFFLHVLCYALAIHGGIIQAMQSSLKNSGYYSLSNQQPDIKLAAQNDNTLSVQEKELEKKMIALEKRMLTFEKQNISITSSRILHIEKRLINQIELTKHYKERLENIETILGRLPITATTISSDKSTIQIPLKEMLEKIDENLVYQRKEIEESLEKILTTTLHNKVDTFTHQKINEQNQAFYAGIITPLDNKLKALITAHQQQALWHNQNAMLLRTRCHSLKRATKELKDQAYNLNATTSNQKYALDLVKNEVKLLRKELSLVKNQKNKLVRRKSF